jgi:hypothetical protein
LLPGDSTYLKVVRTPTSKFFFSNKKVSHRINKHQGRVHPAHTFRIKCVLV